MSMSTLNAHIISHLCRNHSAEVVMSCIELSKVWRSMTDGTPDDGLYPTRVQVTYGTEGPTCIEISDDAAGYRRATIVADGPAFDGHAFLDWAADTDHLTVSGNRTVLIDA